eukprot:GEMP01032187.1.p1 GENE.GEMP01032187.1~~GEMP01032187.1.p1  ORF type:complete len:254 (+),score=49.31 GEMP01032187.1:87-848(+)
MFNVCSATKEPGDTGPERHYVYDTDEPNQAGENPSAFGCSTPTKVNPDHELCHLPDPLLNRRKHEHCGDGQGSPRSPRGAPDGSPRQRDHNMPNTRDFVERKYEPKPTPQGPIHPLDQRNHPVDPHTMYCYEANTHLDGAAIDELAKKNPGDHRHKTHEEDRYCPADANVKRDGDRIDEYISQFYQHAAPSSPKQGNVPEEDIPDSGRHNIGAMAAFDQKVYEENRQFNYGSAVRRGQGNYAIKEVEKVCRRP